MVPPTYTTESWSLGRRVAFRFLFVYFLLYLFPFPLNMGGFLSPLDNISGMARLRLAYEQFWNTAMLWVGKHVLHRNQDLARTIDSGDTVFDGVKILSYAVLATAAAVTWSIWDRRRLAYPRLHAWMRIYVRYALGVIMLGYGLQKVTKVQFPFPDLNRLLMPFGQSTSIGLLWTFMGYSTTYTVFGGACEVLGGLLLFFRRTTTLGALVLIGVLGNVVMLNFSYDVTVKLYSLHLFLMSVWLVLPDLKRLANFLVLNRPTAPASLVRPFSNRWLHRAALGAKVAFVGGILVVSTRQSVEVVKRLGEHVSKPALYGIYEVEAFARNGEAVPPLITDERRWRKVVIQVPMLSIHRMDDSVQHFFMTDDPVKKTIKLTWWDQQVKIVLSYTQSANDHLFLAGDFLNDTISVQLRKVPDSSFPLLNGGFHLISDEHSWSNW